MKIVRTVMYDRSTQGRALTQAKIERELAQAMRELKFEACEGAVYLTLEVAPGGGMPDEKGRCS